MSLQRPLVLCYHGVSDDWSHRLVVRTDTFERQVRSLLRRGFRPAAAGEVVERRGRLVHVTFDDAYRNITGALSILERLGMPATVFAASAYAETGRPLDIPELVADAAAHPEHMATLDWDELRALAERGVGIGSHTVSHAHLTRLSESELERELRDSRTRFEDELGRPCRFLAYPYGEHDAHVHAAVARAGYEAAFSLGPGSSYANRFALPRIDLYPRDSLLRTTLKTSFVKRPASRMLALARRRPRIDNRH
jgi:peptidoglycan/xylan/chitin deacetylase (PgdA/CDA1 family)